MFGTLLLAQEQANFVELQQQSQLGWIFSAAGPFYAVLIPLLGLALFGGACLIVAFSRRPAVLAAYLALIPLPVLVGIIGSLQGLISAYQIVAMSASAPPPSLLGQGLAAALITTLLGMVSSLPAYLVTCVALLIRTILNTDEGNSARAKSTSPPGWQSHPSD